jgi:chromosome segregation ATPase
MADSDAMDIQRVIDQSVQRTTLSDLARRGIQRVKVLDERAIQNLIRQAVDRVLSTRTSLMAEEERSRLMSDSRRELDRLLREHKEMRSRAELLEVGKNDLVSQVENLQRQLQLQRHVEGQNIQKRVDQETATLQARVHELEGTAEAAQKELRNLRGQYNRLVGEHTALQTQLDDARSEGDRLQKQLVQIRKQEGEGHSQLLQAREAELRGRHEEEVGALRKELVLEQDRHRQALARLSSAGDIDAKLAALQDNIEKKFQAVQESSLAAKLEQLGSKDKETAEKLERLFARMTDNLSKRLAGMRAVGAGAEEAEYRPGERMLESMFKQELESNMPTVSPQKADESKAGTVEDALTKLRRMQGLGGGSSGEKK